MIYGRDAQGRFISKKRSTEQKELVERTRPTAKIVTFKERIRTTRIARTVERAYPIDVSDNEIALKLQSQYDKGGNYVLNITAMRTGYMKPGDEIEIERGPHGSADVSP